MSFIVALFDVALFIFSVAVIHNLFRPKQKPPEGLRPNCLMTKHPIVFVHGLKNFFIITEYFNGIPRFLAQHGYKCFEPRLAWRTPASLRKQQLNAQLDSILLSSGSQKVHLIAHSLGGIDALELCTEDPSFSQKIASLTLVTTPIEGSLFYFLAKYLPFTGDIKIRFNPTYRKQWLMNSHATKLPFTGVVVAKGSAPFKGSPGLFVQKYLWRLLRLAKSNESFDGLVLRSSQIAGFQIFWEFEGDHFQAIGSGVWPKGKKTAHEHFLDHAIFLAERDLIS